jgi:hypothetical protein
VVARKIATIHLVGDQDFRAHGVLVANVMRAARHGHEP